MKNKKEKKIDRRNFPKKIKYVPNSSPERDWIKEETDNKKRTNKRILVSLAILFIGTIVSTAALIMEGEFDKIANLYIRTDYEGAVKILYYTYYQSMIQVALIIMGCILLAIAIYLFTFADVSEIEHPKRKWLRRIVFFIGMLMILAIGIVIVELLLFAVIFMVVLWCILLILLGEKYLIYKSMVIGIMLFPMVIVLSIIIGVGCIEKAIGSAEDLKRLEAKDFQKYTGRIYLRAQGERFGVETKFGELDDRKQAIILPKELYANYPGEYSITYLPGTGIVFDCKHIK